MVNEPVISIRQRERHKLGTDRVRVVASAHRKAEPIYLQQIGKTGGILSNNWAGNSYVNRHWDRPVGVKLTKAQKNDSNTKYTYPGAVIGDPQRNAFGHVITNVIDLDYAGMYPSLIILNNLFPDTIRYRFYIDPNQFKNGRCINQGIGANNDKDDTQINYADAIFGDYITGNLIAFMYNWFACPDIDQIYADIIRRRMERRRAA